MREVRGPERSVTTTTTAAAAATEVIRRRSPLHHVCHERMFQCRRGARAPLQERRHVHIFPERGEVGGHTGCDGGVHVAVESVDVGVYCAEERGQSIQDLVVAWARGEDTRQCIARWWYRFARGYNCRCVRYADVRSLLCCGGFLQHAQLRG
jgi:hypothetical protein